MTTSDQSAALSGRLPVLPQERLFTSGGAFLATCIVFGAAIWVFMTGAGLAMIGDIRVTIPGYVIGSTIGYVIVMFGSGLPSFRYGIDPMDAAKAHFGQRGALFPLIALLCVALSWAGVVTAFLARSGVTVANSLTGQNYGKGAETLLGLAAVVVSWLLVRRGPKFMEAINNIVGPALIVMLTVLLVLLANRIGWNHLWTAHRPAGGWLFPNRHVAFLSAIELGMSVSLGAWPFIGGFTRLVKARRHVVTHSLLGTTLIGTGFGSGVVALVANAMPSPDPMTWFIALGGPVLGGIAAVTILIGNVAAIGLLIYVAAVAAQQIRWVRRLPWTLLIAVLLAPACLSAFYVQTVLSSVLAVCNYQTLLFVGISGVSLASYLWIDRQHIDLRSVFAPPGEGRYSPSHGFRRSAIAGVVAGTIVYRVMYDPMTLAPGPGFNFVGASIPALFISIIVFLILSFIFKRRDFGRTASRLEL